MKKILTIFLFVVLMSACGGSSVAPASEVVSTASSTSESTTTRTLTAQEIIDKSKTVMSQLREYWYLDEKIIKAPSYEMKFTESGNFQSPDKAAGSLKVPGESLSFITIGKTCYVAEDEPGEQEWSEFECAEGTRAYEQFLPGKNNSLLDLGITATPELIESDGDRPTAYFIDNGGSTDFSRIEGTDLWAELFLGGDAPGMPERFRIQYWINAENFRLQTLVLSFYIAPEAIEDPESFGLEEGDPLEVIWVLEFRPLAEEVPEIKPPVISAMPTPAPAAAAPTAPPTARPAATPTPTPTAPPAATATPTPTPTATVTPAPARTATASPTEEVAEIKLSAVPLFIAVGEQGTILTSSDGTTWTEQYSGTTQWLRGGAYGNSTLVVVGFLGTILTSLDGTDWIIRDSGIFHDLGNVTYKNSTFMAVGRYGRIVTSSDGTTWTEQYSGFPKHLWGVTYGNNIWVTAGDDGTIFTSSDGTDWFNRTAGITEELNEVIYANNTFVIFGNNGTILTSLDGIDWNVRDSGTFNNLPAGTYGNGTFVAVGRNGTIITSTDAVTWTSRTSGTSEHLRRVVYKE